LQQTGSNLKLEFGAFDYRIDFRLRFIVQLTFT
jgi:hypothetical protein